MQCVGLHNFISKCFVFLGQELTKAGLQNQIYRLVKVVFEYETLTVTEPDTKSIFPAATLRFPFASRLIRHKSRWKSTNNNNKILL